MAVYAAIAVGDCPILVELYANAVAYVIAMRRVADAFIGVEQIVRALIDRDAIRTIAMDRVVGNDVVGTLPVQHDPGQLVVVGLVLEYPAVVDLARDDDAVSLARVVGRVAGDDQPVRAVMRVDAVDDIFPVHVTDDHHIIGLVTVEAVEQILEGGFQDPAGGCPAMELAGQRRAELRQRDPIGFRSPITEAAEAAAGKVDLRAGPGGDERPELGFVQIRHRPLLQFIPGFDRRVGNEQPALVDQEGTALQ